jgi:hypothetical protein
LEIKEEAGWHEGMGSQEDNGTAVLTYNTISVPVNVFCTVSLQEFLHFRQTIAGLFCSPVNYFGPKSFIITAVEITWPGYLIIEK